MRPWPAILGTEDAVDRSVAHIASADLMVVPEVHIHEDVWGMRVLYPLEAQAAAEADIAEARRAGEANRDPSGFGWTDIHLIKPPDITFADVGLTAARAVEVLGAHLPEVARFVATASAGFEPGEHDALGVYDDQPVCYGHDSDAFIKVDVEGGSVVSVWFELATRDVARAWEVRRALAALDAETPCLIADYWLDVTGAVSDDAFLDTYFAALINSRDD